MNYKYYGLIILSLISTATIAAEERSAVKFDALPEAVRNTVSHYIDQKNISKIEQVSDTGYVKFEIESTQTVNKKDFVEIDMIVAADGEIIKMAKEAPFFELPFPVMKKLNQLYPDLKVDEVESVQRRYFQLSGKNNGLAVNLKVYDDGEIQEIPADQNNKAPQPKKPDAQSADIPLTPQQGTQLPNPAEDDELPIDHADDNIDLNQPQ